MSDAFRCNACGDYCDQAYRFVGIDMNTDAIRVADFTLDDLPTDVWNLTGGEGEDSDLCTECGREALETLVEYFDGGDQR